MTTEKKGRCQATLKRTSRADSTPRRKWVRVLGAFLTRRSLNRIEAARELGDVCLPSTVAALQERRISILRRLETIPGFAGLPSRLMRYRLDRAPENVRLARAVLKAQVAAR